MKQTRILSGNFAGEGSKGNFSGYNAKGDRIFIHKRQMEALGFTSNENLVFPFFAIVGQKEINLVDADGNITEDKTLRTQALSVFKTKEDMISAYNSDMEFEIEAKVSLGKTAKASGLSDEAVKALLEVAI
jgi:hypothetical protein